jgi:hypothetical protein
VPLELGHRVLGPRRGGAGLGRLAHLSSLTRRRPVP